MSSVEYAFKRMHELMGKVPPEKTNNFDYQKDDNDDRRAPVIDEAALPRAAAAFRMSPLRSAAAGGGGAATPASDSNYSDFRSHDSAAAAEASPPVSMGAVLSRSSMGALDISTPHLSFNDSLHVSAAAAAADGRSRRSASRSVIPHESLAAAAAAAAAAPVGAKKPTPAPRRFLTMRELARLNFKRNFNITIRPEDEITLDHTSCSEEEHEIAAGAQKHNNACAADDSDSDAVHLDDTLNADDDDDDERRLSLDVEFGAPEASRSKHGDDDADDDDSDGMGSIKARAASIFAAKKRAFERTRRLTKQRHREMKKLNTKQRRPPAADGNVTSKRRRMNESSSSGVSLGSSDTSLDDVEDDDGADCAEVASTLGRMTGCFRCLYGQEEYDSVNNEDMAHLHKLHYENIGKIDPMCIALIMHKFYNTTIRPKAVARGQYLPPWRSKSILVCNQTHNWNPETQIVTHLHDITTVLSYMKNKLSSAPKRKREDVGAEDEDEDDDDPHLKYLAEYNKTLKTLAWFSYLRPEKMVCYNPNQQIKLGDPRVYSRDIVLRVDRSVEANKASRQRLLKAK